MSQENYRQVLISMKKQNCIRSIWNGFVFDSNSKHSLTWWIATAAAVVAWLLLHILIFNATQCWPVKFLKAFCLSRLTLYGFVYYWNFCWNLYCSLIRNKLNVSVITIWICENEKINKSKTIRKKLPFHFVDWWFGSLLKRKGKQEK